MLSESVFLGLGGTRIFRPATLKFFTAVAYESPACSFLSVPVRDNITLPRHRSNGWRFLVERRKFATRALGVSLWIHVVSRRLCVCLFFCYLEVGYFLFFDKEAKVRAKRRKGSVKDPKFTEILKCLENIWSL